MKKTLLFLSIAFVAMSAMAQEAQTFTRKILIEQFTTAQCGYCPAGADRIHEVVDGVKNIIWIKHHAGFGTDDLTNGINETMTVFYGGSTFAPAMMIDRTRFNSSDAGPVGNVGNVSAIRALVSQAKEVPTYCKIYTPSISFDPASRQLTGTITGRFSDAVYDQNTRLTVFVIEDSIFMQQHDYYNGVSSNSYNVDYWHMASVRDAITNMWGDAINVDEANEMNFAYDFSYTLPAGYEYKNCKIVAFIYNRDANNINNNKVMNAVESDYLDKVLGIGQVASAASLRLFPNPANERVVLESDAVINHVSVVNAMGQTLLQCAGNGTQHFDINLSGFASGIYLVRILTAQGPVTRQLVVK
ncbi:MAG: Omp28-related outer membrane protein [Bacteroidales bacterium]|nr:Omp28-related outer membrane protein [Bacteroidales bacterium]